MFVGVVGGVGGCLCGGVWVSDSVVVPCSLPKVCVMWGCSLFVRARVPWMNRSKIAIVDARSLLYSVRCARCAVRGVGNGGCAGIGLVRCFGVLLRSVASLFLRSCLLCLGYFFNSLTCSSFCRVFFVLDG